MERAGVAIDSWSIKGVAEGLTPPQAPRFKSRPFHGMGRGILVCPGHPGAPVHGELGGDEGKVLDGY